jgi:large exoprotein involved in heme utilization and adhesion
MNKKLLAVAAVAITAGGLVLTTSTAALAQSNSTNNPMQTLVQKIAEKFGLKPEDVQSVVNDFKTQNLNQRETMFEAQLDQLVKDGKITENQKQLIINKRKELAANRQNKMQDLRNWAKENNIDMKYLVGLHRSIGMRRGWFK